MIKLFITGSSRGIGRAIAEAACESGDIEVTGYARGEGISHPRYKHITIDLSNAAALAAFAFPRLKKGFEQIVLVNNAGSLGEIGRVGQLDAEVILQTVQVNLSAPLVLSNAFVRDYGNYPASRLMLHISTGAASNPYDGWSLYCSTKAGLDMLARVQDKELALRKDEWPVMVRAVAPGVVETAMQESLRAADPEQFSSKSKFVDLHEQGKLGKPARVAEQYLNIIRSLGEDAGSWPELISRIPAERP